MGSEREESATMPEELQEATEAWREVGTLVWLAPDPEPRVSSLLLLPSTSHPSAPTPKLTQKEPERGQ